MNVIVEERKDKVNDNVVMNFDLNQFNSRVVQYGNDFNNTRIEGLTEREHKVLMLVMSKLKRRGTDEVVIFYEELLSINRFENLNATQLEQILEDLGEKANKKMTFTDSDRFGGHIYLFPTWVYDRDYGTLRVSINEKYLHFTNGFDEGNYTTFKYASFSKIDGNLGQMLCRILSQWKSLGELKISFDEFSRVMCLPEYLKLSPSKTHSIAIKKTIEKNEEVFLSMFEDLKCSPIIKNRKIVGFTFTWKPTYGTRDKWDPNKYKRVNKSTKISDDEINKLKDSY